jgi:SHS2 domain-containing protein
MAPAPGYRFLPHTTDAYIEATGSTFEHALENAGVALFDTMCDVKSISPQISESLEAEGRDNVTLLYDWLESLLLKFELEGKVYSKFKVNPVKRSGRALRIKAKASGEAFDRSKHTAKVEVKAVTFHKMEIIKRDSTTVLRFILDL